MSEPVSRDEIVGVKRLNLDLTPDRLGRLQALAKRRNTTVASTVRSAVHLLDILDCEVSRGQRLAVIDATDRVVKEFIIVD